MGRLSRRLRRLRPRAVASLTPDDVEKLAQDQRIIRNRRKIQATVDNAHVRYFIAHLHRLQDEERGAGPTEKIG